MTLNREKPPTEPPKSGENPEIDDDDVSFPGRFLASTSLGTMSAPFGLRLRQETTMDDPLENVQPSPVDFSGRAESWAPRGRELACFAKWKRRTAWRLT
jgi:hypothetical protein